MISYDQKLHIYTSDLISTGGFGTKFNGDGRVKENRHDLLEQSDNSYKTIVLPHQCHSVDVEVVKPDSSNARYLSLGRCDGVITMKKEVALTIITADCTPIIYSDPVAGIIGISHQGWKGTLGMLPKMICSQMATYGAKSDNICCAIGPSINDCCYEIYGERLDQFKQGFGDEVLREAEDHKTYLNLIKANYMTLLKAGIKKENIDYFPLCTSCNKEQFYSYHRDGGIKGEMISYIVQ